MPVKAWGVHSNPRGYRHACLAALALLVSCDTREAPSIVDVAEPAIICLEVVPEDALCTWTMADSDYYFRPRLVLALWPSGALLQEASFADGAASEKSVLTLDGRVDPREAVNLAERLFNELGEASDKRMQSGALHEQGELVLRAFRGGQTRELRFAITDADGASALRQVLDIWQQGRGNVLDEGELAKARASTEQLRWGFGRLWMMSNATTERLDEAALGLADFRAHYR